jgi:hypothetical protein
MCKKSEMKKKERKRKFKKGGTGKIYQDISTSAFLMQFFFSPLHHKTYSNSYGRPVPWSKIELVQQNKYK